MGYIGLDIGGTKIAGGVFSDSGEQIESQIVQTPKDYDSFLAACAQIVAQMDPSSASPVGIGLPGMMDLALGGVSSANLPFLAGRPLKNDLSALMKREVILANDANCLALAEAVDGAGRGARSVLGLIIGTGVGGGIIYEGKIIEGPNGLAGEIGHLPLPYREESDGPAVPCGCGQKDCIEKFIAGPALARLYAFMTGEAEKEAPSIVNAAEAGDQKALSVLDRYYEIVAKAMVLFIHAFDPEIIVVSGGMSNLSGLYTEVPKRWGKYCLAKEPKTRIVPAKHGPMAGLRGAAFLTRR